jgi:hypothetical protein
MIELNQTYCMPRHKTYWQVIKIDQFVYLKGKHTTLECRQGTLEWLLERGILKLVERA